MSYNGLIQIDATGAVSNTILWNIGFHRKTEVQFIFLLACPSNQKNRPPAGFSLDVIPKEDESALRLRCCAAVWKELTQASDTEHPETMDGWLTNNELGNMELGRGTGILKMMTSYNRLGSHFECLSGISQTIILCLFVGSQWTCRENTFNSTEHNCFLKIDSDEWIATTPF